MSRLVKAILRVIRWLMFAILLLLISNFIYDYSKALWLSIMGVWLFSTLVQLAYDMEKPTDIQAPRCNIEPMDAYTTGSMIQIDGYFPDRVDRLCPTCGFRFSQNELEYANTCPTCKTPTTFDFNYVLENE